MAEQKEVFFGLGRTFAMSSLGLIASTVLLVMGVIPDAVTMGQWVMLLGVTNGTYTAKSVAEKLASRNGGKS